MGWNWETKLFGGSSAGSSWGSSNAFEPVDFGGGFGASSSAFEPVGWGSGSSSSSNAYEPVSWNSNAYNPPGYATASSYRNYGHEPFRPAFGDDPVWHQRGFIDNRGGGSSKHFEVASSQPVGGGSLSDFSKLWNKS